MRSIALLLSLSGFACQPAQTPCIAIDVCTSREVDYPCRATKAFEDGCPADGPTADGLPAHWVATGSGSTTAYRVECLDGRTRYCGCEMIDGKPAWHCINAI